MPTDTYGVWVPDSGTPPPGPPQLAQMRDSFSSRLVLQAVDAADRDAKYPNAPKGTLVVSGDSGTEWLRVAGPGGVLSWKEWHADTGWVSAGFTIHTENGWTTGSYMEACIAAGVTEIRGHVTRVGDLKPAAGASGAIGDSTIVTVPAPFTAPSGRYYPATGKTNGNSCELALAGSDIILVNFHNDAGMTDGNYLYFQFRFRNG